MMNYIFTVLPCVGRGPSQNIKDDLSRDKWMPAFAGKIGSVVNILFFCLLLTSCGFRPVYQNTNTVTGGVSVLNSIWIDTIPNEAGLELRNALIDRFYNNGTPEKPPYRLRITLTERGRDLVIRRDSTTTRTQLVITADYVLMETATGQEIERGSMRAASAYNILSSQYTTQVTQDEARHQVLTELADKITLRMAVVAGR